MHGASDYHNAPLEFAEMAGGLSQGPAADGAYGVLLVVDQAIQLSKRHANLYLETSRAPIFEISVAVKELGPDKVIWGTDSPFVDYEWEFKKMERATADKEGYAKIVGGNMARLLRL